MPAVYHSSKIGDGAPVLTRIVIDNSDVIRIGDFVRAYNAGHIEVAVAARPLFGVVHAVEDIDGLQPTPDSGTLDTFTVASDNETVAQIAALVDTSIHSVYSCDQDGTLGTTNSSDQVGASFDLADEETVDESTSLRTGPGQLYGWGADPEDSTRVLVSIMESELHSSGVYS